MPSEYDDINLQNTSSYLTLNKLVPSIINSIFKVFRQERFVFSSLIIILLLGMIFNLLSDNNTIKSVSNITNTVIVLAVVATISVTINSSVLNVIEAINSINDFSAALTPIFCGIITTSGNPTSAAVTGGWLYLICQILGYITKYLIIPLIGMYFSVIICASCVSNIRLNIFVSFLKKVVNISLTTMFFLFSSLMTLQSFLTVANDSMAKKSVRFAVSSLIPVAGNALSDGMDMVFTSANIAKSSIGVFGIIIIIGCIIYPLVSVVMKYLIFKLAAFIADVLGNTKISDFLENVSSIFGILTAITLSSSLMLVFSIAIGFSIGK
ncbi:MAG: hypothetical protein RR073_02680 [Clostridia bacterium]